MSDKMPLVSFIIPVYNGEKYLGKCLDLIVGQEFKDWEVILINDGSIDDSGVVCDSYAKNDSRIKVFHQSNQGVSATRNRGLDLALGEWIWFVDADDEIVPHSLKLLADVIRQTNCDTILSGLVNIYLDGRVISDKVTKDFNSAKEEILEKVFAFQNGMVLFSKKLIEENNLRFSKNIKIGEDLEFQYKYLLHCKHPISLGRCLYAYKRRQNSAMHRPDMLIDCMNNSINIVQNILDHLNKVHPGCSNGKWLSDRLRLMLKAGLQAASQLQAKDRLVFKKNFKKCIKRIETLNLDDVVDKTLRLAFLCPDLYFFIMCKFLQLKNR